MTLLALGTTLIAAGRLVDAEACYDEAAELTIAVGLVIYFAYRRKHSLRSPDSPLHARTPASGTQR